LGEHLVRFLRWDARRPGAHVVKSDATADGGRPENQLALLGGSIETTRPRRPVEKTTLPAARA
jgi:hypothetical protein